MKDTSAASHNSQFDGIVDHHQCFNSMVELQRKYHLSSQDKESLKTNEREYFETYAIKSQLYQEKNIQKIAKDNLRLYTEVHQNHVRTLKITQMLFSQQLQSQSTFSSKLNLNRLTFNCDNISQIYRVASICKMATAHHLDAFYFLSQYLFICIRKYSDHLKHSSQSVLEVENKLVEILNQLKKKHPPNDNQPSGEEIHEIPSIKQKKRIENQIGLLFMRKIRQMIFNSQQSSVSSKQGVDLQVIEERFEKVVKRLSFGLQIMSQAKEQSSGSSFSARQRQSKNQEQSPSKQEKSEIHHEKQNSRNIKSETEKQQTSITPSKTHHKKSIDLSLFADNEKNHQLQLFIIEIATLAKNSLNDLVEITKSSCLNNNGRQYRSGLKVTDPNHTSAIDRVKQKLLSKEFAKINIPSTNSDQNADENILLKFMKEQKDYYHNQLAQIFSKTQKVIEFTVSDMLRGKCMFKEVSEINKTAREIIRNCKEKGHPIVEIDNRLDSKTTDLVFKICINGIVAEFQLAYMFNTVDNEFNHKIYELLRSKFFTTISTLREFNEKALTKRRRFLSELQACSSMESDIRTTILKSHKQLKQSNFTADTQVLLKELKDWFVLCYAQDSTFKNSLTRKEEERSKSENNGFQIDSVPSIYFSTPKPLELKENKLHQFYLLSALYCKEFAKYQQSIKFLDFFLQEDKVQKLKPQIQLKFVKLKAQCLQSKGNLDFCLKYLEKRLQLESQLKGQKSIECSNVLYRIAFIESKIGNYQKSLQFYTQCLEMQEQILGQESFQCSKTLSGLGQLCYNEGNYPKALEYYERCLSIRSKISGKDSIEYAFCLHQIGQVYQGQGKHNKAIEYYHESLQIKHQIKGKDSLTYSITLMKIGNIYKDKGNYQESLKLFQQCLEIEELINGQGCIGSAMTLNSIGLIYFHKGDYKNALSFYEKSLRIKQDIKGQGSIDTSGPLSNIGRVHFKMGQYDLAIEYQLRSLKIRQRVKGENCIDSVANLNNLGEIYNKMGLYEQALECCMKSLEIRQKIKGKDSFTCSIALNSIGDIYQQMGQYEDALKYYNQSLTLKTKFKGENCIESAVTLNNIGEVYKKKESYDQALKYSLKCLHIQENVKGKGCIDSAETLNNIGSIYLSLENHEKAMEHLKESLNIQEKILGKDSIDSSETLKGIGDVFSKKDELTDALEYYLRSLKIKGQLMGKQSVDSVQVLYSMGNVYEKTQNLEKANETFSEVIKILENLPNHKKNPLYGSCIKKANFYKSLLRDRKDQSPFKE